MYIASLLVQLVLFLHSASITGNLAILEHEISNIPYPDCQSICLYPCHCLSQHSEQLSSSCDNLSLTSVPAGLATNTHSLSLSGNNLVKLQENMFAEHCLHALHKQVLSQCGLEEVQQQAFLGLGRLEELDLSLNFMEEVRSRSFVNIQHLKYLNLKKESHQEDQIS